MEPFEPPKYIASLIAAINDGAKSAQLGALAFTAIGLFLLATAFSATDEDLLLNHAIAISQLGGAQVPVVLSFGLAPGVFLAAHLYTLIRYDMLAGNVRRLLVDLPAMVPREANQDRCRQLLANVEFVQALVTPKGSRAASWMFGLTVRVLLAGFPVMVLLLVQLQSLRLQNEVVTWINHIGIAADLILLVWFFNRLRGDGGARSLPAMLRRAVALGCLPALILAMDLLWLQVPGPDSVTVGKTNEDYSKLYPGPFGERALWLVNFQPVDLLLCHPGAWGCRFLSVTHRTLVGKVWDAKTFVELRGGAETDVAHLASFEPAALPYRALRFADLTASELYSADLTGTDLRHAVLNGVQLKGATLREANMEFVRLSTAHLEYANIRSAHLKNARMREAHLEGADLSASDLERADLSLGFMRGAVLAYANLSQASLSAAHLEGANLVAAYLDGTNLANARFDGADLVGAKLNGANLGTEGSSVDVWSARSTGIDERTHFEAADMRKADIWHVENAMSIEIGLASLPEAPSLSDSPTAPSLDTPNQGKQRFAGSPASAGSPTDGHMFREASTSVGQVLIGTTCTGDGFRGIPCDRTTTDEVANLRAAIDVWTEKVAVTHPAAAEAITRKIDYDLLPDDPKRLVYLRLACRLIAQTEEQSIRLKPDTIKRLRNYVAGSC